MGVPGFFAWLLRKDNNILLNELPSNQEIHTLYLDANCLIHPKCYEILNNINNSKLNIYDRESKMIGNIVNYILKITNIVRPICLYIAVDGVAPMAKISQQRKRRYKSYLETLAKNEIKQKHNIPNVTTLWNSCAITPGTEFMERLHESLMLLQDYLISIRDMQVQYSSYHSPGEGEHKILQEIKNNNNKNNKNIVIYGLDADLIFLSLASNRDNIYLMRESQEINFNKENLNKENKENLNKEKENLNKALNLNIFKYVSIDKTKFLIKNKLFINIKDFIFICYFLGNDFLPTPPSIHVKTGGLDLLINTYLETYNILQANLINNNTNINVSFLTLFLTQIASCENYYFTNTLPRFLNRRAKICETEYLQEIYDLENLKNVTIKDHIKLNQHNFKSRYYNYYFNNFNLNKIVSEYLTGLNWVTQYYFNKVASWDFQYTYTHPPFISDIVDYLNLNNKINKVINLSKPITPCTQLLLVAPPIANLLLPKSYANLISKNSQSKIKYMYPNEDEVNLDMINKFVLHECILNLPTIELNVILENIKDLKLTKDEAIRDLVF
jgi:5'-3' exoribonuclease 1